MAEREFEIFVPGRVCLFGEHSDWAGGHRRINSSITPGYAIICGTNQGIRARVHSHPDRLIFHSSLTADGIRQEFDIPMQPDSLLAEARKGGFFSYVAGVAYQVLTHNTVKGPGYRQLRHRPAGEERTFIQRRGMRAHGAGFQPCL